MADIDIKNYPTLKDELDDLAEDDFLYIQEDGEDKYVVMPMSLFKEAENLMDSFNSVEPKTVVKVISTNGELNPELTYEEYEKIKKQFIKTLDDTFKPKPEKLN